MIAWLYCLLALCCVSLAVDGVVFVKCRTYKAFSSALLSLCLCIDFICRIT